MARAASSSVSVLCLVSALAAAGPAASVSARPPPGVHDGEVTPDACARLGFPAAGRDEDRVGRRGRPAYVGGGVAAPNIAPPATANYHSAQAVQESAVAERRAHPDHKTRPPPPPPPAAVFPVGPAPYPQAFARQDTERYPDATPNPIRRVADAPVSTFSIDVDTASYANVRRFLGDGARPPRDAVRVEEMINYFDYDYVRPARGEAPFRPFVAVAPSPWGAGKQIIHIGLQGYDTPRAEQPPLNLVFLIDVSGSMGPEDRLPLAKKALGVLIDQLRPQDTVAMVVYAGAAGAVLAPTGGAEKLKMRCALGALESGGSTAGGAGLALAYGLAEQNFDRRRVNRVVLLTDGDFNVGVANPEKLEDFVAEKRQSGVYLSVYGFGRGNYNDALMQTLSQSGNGTAAYVDSLNEARKLFRDDFSGSIFPIADDVKIQVEFNPAQVSEYRLIGYETRMLNREDFNNDQVDAGEVGAGASVTALYEITPIGGPLSSDPLRYGREAPARPGGGELAYLKVRYKAPGGRTSQLIERPIGQADRAASVDAAPEATRWALAVASYGQKLRGDAYVPAGFGWDRVGALAQGARGSDPFGLRAEFVQLVRAAETARSPGP